MKPIRLQRSRRKGSRLVGPNGLPVVCVTRPSKWGNPFKIGEEGPMGRKATDKLGAVGFFRAMFEDEKLRIAAGYPSVHEIRRELAGKNLACYCKLDEACHADVLLEISNGGAA